MASYRLSEQADEDLLSINVYSIANFGMEQANRYQKELVAALEFLADNPAAARLRHGCALKSLHPFGHGDVGRI